MYEYKAIVKKVYDGDTITVDIDLWFGITFNDKSIRLSGIDTPEIRWEELLEGLMAKEALLSLIPVGSEVLLKTDKDSTGKYGRYIADVFLPNSEISTSVNDWLVENGGTLST